MAPMQIVLEREKETKNTVRYLELGDEPAIGMIYVPKRTLSVLGNPERIAVELSAAESHERALKAA